MANWSDPRIGASQPTTTVGRDVAFDAGLRAHMLSVYNYMTSGVLLSGIVAMLFARSGMAFDIMVNGGLLRWVIILAPLGMVMWLSFGINRISTATAQILFWVFAFVMGLSLSTIFLVYDLPSIATTFFATAAAFAGLSLWGYSTKKDLSAIGTFLVMGLFGLIVAMLINVFWQNTMFDLVISAIGVLIFAGLTAWDTQKIKEMYDVNEDGTVTGRKAVMGALSLYLDFINLFLFLLRFMGNRN